MKGISLGIGFWLFVAFRLVGQTPFFYTQGGNGFDAAYAIASGPNGSFMLLSGSTWQSNGDIDPFITRIEQDGTPIWRKTFGLYDSEFPVSLKPTEDGNLILASTTFSVPAGQSGDILLTLIDENGSEIWSKIYGFPGIDLPGSVIPISGGGYMVVATRSNGVSGISGIWIFKLDASGNLQWDQLYDPGYSGIAEEIVQLADGTFLISGNIEENSSQTPQKWLAHMDQDGGFIWEKKITRRGTGSSYSKLLQTKDEGLLLLETGGHHAIRKLSLDGSFLWERETGPAFSMFEDHAQNLIIVGESANGGDIPTLTKYDKWGETIWRQELPFTDCEAIDVKQASDGGYVICGKCNQDTLGFQTMYAKVSCEGEFISYSCSTVPPLTTLLVYPTLAERHLTIELSNPTYSMDYEAEIWDIHGKRILSNIRLDEGLNQVNTQSLPDGLYFYRVTQDSEPWATGKFFR